jgi:predicted RNase H-like nuclease
MIATTFIGVDPAWKTDGNHSGIAVLEGDAHHVQLRAFAEGLVSMASVVDFVANHSGADSVVAVDAPLVVKNAKGQRPCERLISSEFSRYHAGCHTSNTAKLYADTGMKLVNALSRHGFVHDFAMATAKQKAGRWLFEVYPHPAMVRLFGLDRIIPYKKGSVAQKRRGLGILRRHLEELASGSTTLVRTPALSKLLERDLEILPRRAVRRAPTYSIYRIQTMHFLNEWPFTRRC